MMLLGRLVVALALMLCCVDGIVKSAIVATAGLVDADSEGTGAARRSAIRQKMHELAASSSNMTLPVAASSSIATQLHTQRVNMTSTAVNVQEALKSGEMSAKLLWAYGIALLAMVAIVTFMFLPMGATVVFQVVLYVACLAFVKISMKSIYKYGFNYPKFITSLHLLVSAVASFSVLIYRSRYLGKPIAIPTTSEFLWRLLPISLTFGLSIGAENSALVFVSAAFSEVVASSNPVMSAFLTWSLGMPFNFQLLAPIMLVVIGCGVSVSGEVFFSSFGMMLLFFSVFCRSLKAVMQQQLMSGETKEKFDPVTLMAWTCLCSCLELSVYSLATEGFAPVRAVMAAPALTGLLVTIAISCVIACTLNIAALFVIKQLGAVGMQMVSQMKALLVVIGGMALLSESFTSMQQVGFLMVLAGVYWYSRWKRLLEPTAAKGH